MDMDPLGDPYFHIHQLYLELLSGEATAPLGQPGTPPFFQPTPPPHAPMLGGPAPPPQAPMMGMGGQTLPPVQEGWVVPPAAAGVLPLQGGWGRNDFRFAPGGDAHATATDCPALTSRMGAYPQTPSDQPVLEDRAGFVPGAGDSAPGMDAIWMLVAPAAAPSPSSSGSPDLASQARATDSTAPTTQMGAYQQTPSVLTVPQTVPESGPGFVPEEYSMGSLQACQLPMVEVDSPPVPFAAGPSTSSSGSPGLASQATATDSPAPTSQMCMGAYPQAAAVDVPQPVPEHGAGFVPAREDAVMFTGNDQLVRDLLLSGADLSAFMNDEEAAKVLMPKYPVGSLLEMVDSPPEPPAAWPSQSSSGSPGLGAQAAATDSPAPTSQVCAYPQPVPDDEAAEVAWMVRVAAWCGDRPSTAWSVEEDHLLLQGLSQFAGQDDVSKCFSIAYGLAGKTVIDVAYRIRWLSDLEKKNAKQVQLVQEKSPGGNATKGKETKGANKRNNRYPLSKETLDSRSVQDLIRDNDRLMYKIEEILRTGQLKNSADYFYYVKMNIEALPNKAMDLASVMEGLSVGDEEWEGVFKDRNASAAKDAALPPPPQASIEMAHASAIAMTIA